MKLKSKENRQPSSSNNRNNTPTSEKISTSRLGVPPGWRRATVIIRDAHHEKLKDISYWERVSIKDILDQLLEKFLSTKKTKSTPKSKQAVFSDHNDAEDI